MDNYTLTQYTTDNQYPTQQDNNAPVPMLTTHTGRTLWMDNVFLEDVMGFDAS